MKAIIDLERNCLRIHGEEIPFLAEHDLPPQARQAPVKVEEPAQTSNKVNSEQSSSAQTAVKYSEDIIKTLTSMGVTREEAIQALDASKGNADVAANILFPF